MSQASKINEEPKKRRKTIADRALSESAKACPELITRFDICTMLKISERNLTSKISAGEYPKPDFRVGNLPRWFRTTHERHVAELVRKEK